MVVMFTISLHAQTTNVLVPVKKDGKWGATNLQHKTVISFNYDKVDYYSESYFLVEKNGKKGLYSSVGNKVVECKYDVVTPLSTDRFRVYLNRKIGVIDGKGNNIIPIKYKTIIYDKESGYFIVKNKNKKSALFNSEGGKEVGFKYDNIIFYSNNTFIFSENKKYALVWTVSDLSNLIYYDNIVKYGDVFLVQKNNKQGLISVEGKKILDCNYTDIKTLSTDYLVAKKDKFYAFYSAEGKKISKSIYSAPFYYFNNQVVLANVDDKLVEYDLYSKKQTTSEIEKIIDEKGDYLRVVKNNYVVLINKDGENLFADEYHDIVPLLNGDFKVKFDRKWGVIDSLGNNILPVKYQNITLNKYVEQKTDRRYDISEIDKNRKIYNELYIVDLNGMKGVFTLNGKQIIPIKYTDVGVNQFDKLMWVSLSNMYGVYGRDGKEILKAEYSNVNWNEYQQKITVKQNNGYSVINPKGEVQNLIGVNGLQWLNKKDLITTKTANKSGVINVKGKVVIPFEYSSIYDLDENVIIGVKKKKYFIFNTEGKPIGNGNYSAISEGHKFELNTFYILTDSNNKTGVINAEGKVIVPFKYDKIVFEKRGLFKIINSNKSVVGYYSTIGEKYF